jgi:hypothetical protein
MQHLKQRPVKPLLLQRIYTNVLLKEKKDMCAPISQINGNCINRENTKKRNEEG